MKSYHFKKDSEAKIKEQNNEIAMLEKDRFDLIKANMLLKKQENQIYQNSITISNHQI